LNVDDAHGKAELLGRVAENDDRAHSC
jgi:hypothetical protein